MTFPRKTRKDHQKRPKQVYTVGHEQGKRTCFGDLSVLNSVMKNWKCRCKKSAGPSCWRSVRWYFPHYSIIWNSWDFIKKNLKKFIVPTVGAICCNAWYKWNCRAYIYKYALFQIISFNIMLNCRFVLLWTCLKLVRVVLIKSQVSLS